MVVTILKTFLIINDYRIKSDLYGLGAFYCEMFSTKLFTDKLHPKGIEWDKPEPSFGFKIPR